MERIIDSFQNVKLLESSNSNPRVRGTILISDKPNLNNRIYSSSLVKKIFSESKRRIANRTLLGKLEHIEGGILNNVCVRYTDVELVNGKLIGEGLLLSTPAGKTALEILRNKIGNIGFSTSGKGSLTERNGYSYVEDDYKLIGVDIVFENSNDEELTLLESILERENNDSATSLLSNILHQTLLATKNARDNGIHSF